jgi:hypothetical protein
MSMTETATPARKHKAAQKRVVTVKVTLRGSKPPIWRRLVMPASSSLADLNVAIQSSMGWGNCHLHAFQVDGRAYGDRSTMDDVADESRLTLNGLMTAGTHRFSYTYDFGDNWKHIITIEKVTYTETPPPCPICIAGKRACPPEDSGGIWGYYRFLEVLADPSHPEHADMKDWIEDDFDPEAFEPDDANVMLRAQVL